LPKATVVSAERHVAPIAPPWLWALAATMLLGAHWYGATAERPSPNLAAFIGKKAMVTVCERSR